MDHAVTPAGAPLTGPFPVPPSKSVHQRCLALAALAEDPVRLEPGAPGVPGQDATRLAVATEALGGWSGDALGSGRESLRLDLGEGATGFRFSVALATLRPEGARTLVTGRPALRGRSHGVLLQALRGLGGHVRRRRSGAVRVIGGGMRGGRVDLDAGTSSQFASALLLVAARIGGIDLRLRGRCASLPYLRLTANVLRQFSVPVETDGLEGASGRIQVAEARPAAASVALVPDASCAAAWWAAAALCGGCAVVPGLPADTGQADGALPGMLARMGARVDSAPGGEVRVHGDGTRLRGLGEVDLRDSPDLVFLVGVLAGGAEGETVLRGVSATRGKESDRVAVLAAGLEALGGEVSIEPDDAVRIRGRALHAGRVSVGADHRAAFAFGILGLKVPGIVLRGAARAVGKSHPGFLAALAALGG